MSTTWRGASRSIPVKLQNIVKPFTISLLILFQTGVGKRSVVRSINLDLS